MAVILNNNLANAAISNTVTHIGRGLWAVGRPGAQGPWRPWCA